MSQVHAKRELRIVALEDGNVGLASPDVGEFAAALPRGATLSPGMTAGVLHQLGKSFELVVPAGAGGAIVSDPPKSMMAPVGFGTTLYRLDPEGIAAGGAGVGAASSGAAGDGLFVRAGQSGRVWHSPAPGEPVFCTAGSTVEAGQALCLIEVMKTFSTVPYKAQDGLPARGKVVRWIVEDGGDVESGMPLLEIEPA
ncbi:Biotin carboxyl carrier protein of acetyl-CoA carboxylase [Planctomycetes bacterium Poly30]|uniref:Biotin carboxyl carrier protein of acetyl-CoA carboxylase n=1 Tax=Saltatorellus ferox TaxID=2528018 RepID=A0A518EQP5_9BACT|nr:Biotin carboxyl carrier protein of acetyl-CoA carboxylase [Planctomycetes bacterium Poly30]